MIKLKSILHEGVLFEQLWPEIAKKIPTKYQKEFESLQHGRSTTEALKSFSEDGLQELGSAFDVFVEKNGIRAVKQRGKLEASLTKLPPETKAPESRTPINESIEFDVAGEFSEKTTQSSTLQESVQKLLADYRNNRLQELKQEFPDAKTFDIGIATYSITSTTSKVPSSNPTNEQLQQGRYEAMKSAFKEAASALKIPGATTAPEGQKTLGFSGPEYDKEKYSLVKRNADPAVRSEYESTYGPHRKSHITVQFDIKLVFKPGIPVVKSGESKEDFIFSIRNKTHNRPKLPSLKLQVRFKRSKYRPVKNKFKILPCPEW